MSSHEWLIQKRLAKSMTQEQVAIRTGIDRSYYSKIEHGQIPSVQVAKKIASVLEFDWTIFFNPHCDKKAQRKKEVIL